MKNASKSREKMHLRGGRQVSGVYDRLPMSGEQCNSKARSPLSEVLRFFVVVLLCVITLVTPATAQARPTPLSKDEVITLLKNYASPNRVAELAKERGIRFAMTPETERQLRGVLQQSEATPEAADSLIATLRTLAPKSPAAVSSPTSPGAGNSKIRMGEPPLSQVEILGLLVSTESSPYLARLVNQRGINFTPSEEFVNQLRSAGGEGVLLNAVRTAKVSQGGSLRKNARTEADLVKHVYDGSQFYKKGDLVSAEKEYRSALALDSRNPVLHIVLGEMLLGPKLKEAEAEFQTVVKLWPNSPIAHSDLGAAFALGQNLDAAIAEQRKAIELQPSYSDAHAHLASDLEARGDWQGAVSEYRLAIEAQPDLNSYRIELADKLLEHGDIEGAKILYKEASVSQSADAYLHNRIGLALERAGDWQPSVAEFQQAVRMKPEVPDFHVNLGSAKLYTGDNQNATAEFQVASTLKPDDPLLHLDIGFAFERVADWDTAIQEYRTAIRLNTGDTLTKNLVLLGLTRDPKTGETVLNAISKLGVVHRQLGSALGHKGDWDSDVSEQRTAIALNPNDYTAHNELCVALSWKNQWDASILECREAIRLEPNYAIAHSNLGSGLEDKGDVTGAIEEYRKAYQIDPKNPVIQGNYQRITGQGLNQQLQPGPGGVDPELQRIEGDFVSIPAGEFEMGCSLHDSSCARDEKPRHRVRITKSFEIGRYEVTQGTWRRVMSVSYMGSTMQPIGGVTWDNVQEFLKRLNAQNDGYRYRLPTEAEWEYAARAGSKSAQYGDLDAIAWYSSNAGGQSHNVGLKAPNPWGLYDMLGNVWEWVQDWYGDNYYQASPSTDPQGPSNGERRVLRGGGASPVGRIPRVSGRNSYPPDYVDEFIGFRIVREKVK